MCRLEPRRRDTALWAGPAARFPPPRRKLRGGPPPRASPAHVACGALLHSGLASGECGPWLPSYLDNFRT